MTYCYPSVRVVTNESVGWPTLSNRPSLNSSLMACFNALNPLRYEHQWRTCFGQPRIRTVIPVSFLALLARDLQELLNRVLGTIGLHLLGVVVRIFDVDIAALIDVFIFVLELVAVKGRSVSEIRTWPSVRASSLFLPTRVLHEIIVVVHCEKDWLEIVGKGLRWV